MVRIRRRRGDNFSLSTAQNIEKYNVISKKINTCTMKNQMKKIQLLFGLLFFASLSFGQNVGIGTPTPDYTLDINGSLSVNDTIYHNDDSDTWMAFTAPDTWELTVGSKRISQVDAINSTLDINPDYSDINFLIRGDGINAMQGAQTNTTDALFYADTQNELIGIGTSIPEHLIDIDGGNMLIRGDGINALMFADHNNSRIGIGTTTPQHLIDIDNGNMLIRGDGINALLFVDHFDDKVGIGTNNPQEELHVVGTIKADTIKANHVQIPHIKYGQMLISSSENGTDLFIREINYPESGFTNPPHLFITINDVDNQGSTGAEVYSYSVFDVTPTSAKIRLEETDSGIMFGDIIIYWMAIE